MNTNNIQKVNYQKILDKITDKIEKECAEGENRPALFLHACCAPCSSYVLEYLTKYFKITIFYYNPNISPLEEYQKRVNEQKRLIYYFSLYRGMETKISIQPDWEAYIRKNMEILKGWLRYHMILYLQRRNPSVP